VLKVIIHVLEAKKDVQHVLQGGDVQRATRS